MATDTQIQQLIDQLPTGVKNGISAQKLIDVFQALKERNLFNAWTDIQGIPSELYYTNTHRALIEEQATHFTLSNLMSGFVIFVTSTSSINVGIKATQLDEAVEYTLWQEKEGFINLVDVEGSSVVIPDGKLLQTENIGDSIYLIKRNGKIYVKGQLKDV